MAKSVYIALFLAACAALGGTVRCPAQSRASIAGRITDARTSEPVAGAAVVLDGARLWAVSDGEGRFAIQNVDTVAVTLQCTSLGYRTQTFAITPRNGVNTCDIVLEESNLSLDEVVVTAQKRSESQTSSYLVDRHTLDHAQMFNLDHIAALLPGGKSSGDQNLASAAQRIALHAGGAGELGNASFGTAIDIDGQRIENNAVLNETKGADLRSIGSSNIESVEVVTGIPSVEYGDLSNGMVKINTRKGKSPWSVELMVEPKTRQIALSKGFAWGTGAALNINAEHTRSITALASPFTAYDRNNLNLTYSNTFRDRRGRPLKFLASLSGNLGGYDSKADPDQFQETYTKTRDYSLRGNLKLEWLLDKPWISNLSLQASASYSDRLNETNTNKSSASTQPYIHATEAGYYVGELYEENPDAAVILGPTGYWYVHASTDSKPVTYAVKAKADWSKRWSGRRSRLLAGAEFSGSGNLGRGLFYEERRTAPTWREYRYDELPFMNNAALFVEEKFSTPVGKRSSLHLTAGLRSDMTFLRGSEYGTVATLSPRVNAKYRILEGARGTVSDLAIYAGWGKAVKQPSFAVLYPAPAYSDKLAFAPGTTADGKTFYAYYTQPTPTLRNTALKWQYTIQNEIGIEATAGGTRISVSAFRNRTIHPYMSRTHYTPYTYKLTTQADIEAGCTIPSPNRQYTIDRQTGIVTVKDRTGALPDQVLGYRERNAFAGQTEYTNGSAVERRGIDVVVDFAQIRPHPLRRQLLLVQGAERDARRLDRAGFGLHGRHPVQIHRLLCRVEHGQQRLALESGRRQLHDRHAHSEAPPDLLGPHRKFALRLPAGPQRIRRRPVAGVPARCGRRLHRHAGGRPLQPRRPRRRLSRVLHRLGCARTADPFPAAVPVGQRARSGALFGPLEVSGQVEHDLLFRREPHLGLLRRQLQPDEGDRRHRLDHLLRPEFLLSDGQGALLADGARNVALRQQPHPEILLRPLCPPQILNINR